MWKKPAISKSMIFLCRFRTCISTCSIQRWATSNHLHHVKQAVGLERYCICMVNWTWLRLENMYIPWRMNISFLWDHADAYILPCSPKNDRSLRIFLGNGNYVIQKAVHTWYSLHMPVIFDLPQIQAWDPWETGPTAPLRRTRHRPTKRLSVRAVLNCKGRWQFAPFSPRNFKPRDFLGALKWSSHAVQWRRAFCTG